jgi:hypothetical protein
MGMMLSMLREVKTIITPPRVTVQEACNMLSYELTWNTQVAPAMGGTPAICGPFTLRRTQNVGESPEDFRERWDAALAAALAQHPPK